MKRFFFQMSTLQGEHDHAQLTAGKQGWRGSPTTRTGSCGRGEWEQQSRLKRWRLPLDDLHISDQYDLKQLSLRRQDGDMDTLRKFLGRGLTICSRQFSRLESNQTTIVDHLAGWKYSKTVLNLLFNIRLGMTTPYDLISNSLSLMSSSEKKL